MKDYSYISQLTTTLIFLCMCRLVVAAQNFCQKISKLLSKLSGKYFPALTQQNRDLKVVKEHSVWEQIGTLSGTAQKTFDFSQYEEICLVTTCSGNAKLFYTVKIPVIVLNEDKIHVCNGGYTTGTGAECEWEISKTSCRLLACYVGGTNYTGSATTIYAR